MNQGNNSHAGNILLQFNSEGQRSTKYTGGDKVKIWIWANYGVNDANTKLPTFVCCIAIECIYRVHRECLFQTPFRNYMVFHLNSAGVITCVFYKLKARMEGVGTGAGSSCLKLSKIGSLWDARECESRGRLQRFQSSSGCFCKEMPHHVVESTSWVVTGFFTDVLGSSVAWINFCHSKLLSWIQNIPELCLYRGLSWQPHAPTAQPSLVQPQFPFPLLFLWVCADWVCISFSCL